MLLVCVFAVLLNVLAQAWQNSLSARASISPNVPLVRSLLLSFFGNLL